MKLFRNILYLKLTLDDLCNLRINSRQKFVILHVTHLIIYVYILIRALLSKVCFLYCMTHKVINRISFRVLYSSRIIDRLTPVKREYIIFFLSHFPFLRYSIITKFICLPTIRVINYFEENEL